MVNNIDENGGGGSGRPNRKPGLPFLIEGEDTITAQDTTRNSEQFTGETLEFRPNYIPDRMKLSKERNLVRHANFCGLEDVFEVHGKNREVHISGRILKSELSSFADVLNWNNKATIITPGLPDGLRVRIKKGDREGPVAWDARNKEYLWKYSLDVVSTGDSEKRHIANFSDGIASEGETVDEEDAGSFRDD
jgi:hypothetical protein